MAYTNNVPQGNQQISTTQPLIQANFGFLNTGIALEHNFNSSGSGNDMYHLRASMPNQGLSPSLPAGTNGQYFVNAGLGYFWDATTNWRLNQFIDVLTGTFANTSGFTNVVTVPANTMGFGILYNAVIPAVQHFSFFSNGSKCFAFSSRMKLNSTSDDYPIEMNNNNAALFIQGKQFNSSYTGTYTYKIWYRPA